MKKVIVTTLVFGFALFTLNACGTIEGVGKDLKRAGEVVEKKAKNL